jgi:hypothetical protein
MDSSTCVKSVDFPRKWTVSPWESGAESFTTGHPDPAKIVGNLPNQSFRHNPLLFRLSTMRHSGLLGKPVYFGTMAKAKVAVVRAADYELQLLRPALEKAFSFLGGLEGFIPRGAKVFVKVNLLPPPSPPERAIITHPVFA